MITSAGDGALVLLSGGQDSTTCLAWALEHFAAVETVSFDYGQRHAVELESVEAVLSQMRERFPRWSARLGEQHRLSLPVLGRLSESALTREQPITLGADGLPSTFVPGRNIVFFTFAAILAWRRRLRHLVGGMCETDYAGYPDCRDNAIKATQVALNLGMQANFVIHTPLMWLDKAATWRLASTLGGEPLMELVREVTHSCYLGTREMRHEWGYGCGTCPACHLRAEGYRVFMAGRLTAVDG